MKKNKMMHAGILQAKDVILSVMPDGKKMEYKITKATRQADGLVCLETTSGQDLYYRYGAEVEVIK